MRRPSDYSIPQVVLVGLILAIGVALVVTASTSSAVYGPYNDDWDGTTQLRSITEDTDTEVDVVMDTDAYASVRADGTVALVLSPDSTYRSGQASRVRAFVRGGGTLVVADDYGLHANDLLRSVGADARIDGRLLRDVRSNYRSSAMPVATAVADRQLVAGVESLTLNYGTAVAPHGATPLVNTSEYAYLDADRDGEFDANESLGTYTVATVERVGEGRVVVVGDASAFINAMVERPGNRQFVRLLFARHERLLFDYSHAGGLPPLALALIAVRTSALAQFGLGALVVGVLAVWSRRPDALAAIRGLSPTDARNDGEIDDVRASASELAAHLERQHPDWERDRIERVVSAFERRRNR